MKSSILNRSVIIKIARYFVYFIAVFLTTACSSSSTKSGMPQNVSDGLVSNQSYTNEINAAVLKQQASRNSNGTASTSGQTAMQRVSNTDNKIRPGIKISLEAVEDSNVKGKFQVDFDGQLDLPYGVQVQAAGLSLTELKSELQQAYAPYFRFAPTLRVSLTDKKQLVEVQGLVTKPGKVLVSSEASLDELIAEGGGLGGSEELGGTPKYIRVVPTEGDSFAIALRDYYAGVSPVTFRWRGGDRVFFQSEKPHDLIEGATIERESVQLIGQIVAPGAYPYQSKENFFHYLVLAGGPTERADFRNIEIVRIDGGKKDSKQYDLTGSDVMPDVKSGDIVIVHAQRDDQRIPHATGILSSIATALLAAVAL